MFRIKPGEKRINIKIVHEKVGGIDTFCYLGSKIKTDGHCNADIRSRIGQAKKAFAKLAQSLVSNIHLEIRKKNAQKICMDPSGPGGQRTL